MAEVTAFRNNALPYPVYGVPWTIVFPILDADGDPVTGATCDSEISKNGDTGVDCTNEGTEIPFTTATNKGMYFLTLTVNEMTANVVAITIYPDSGKATPVVLYPRRLVPLRTDTAQGGAAGYITLDASAGTLNDKWNGCLCVAVIDGNVEARIIDDYNGSNQQASVTPDWNVVPDADDPFVIYLPEGIQIPLDPRLPEAAADAAGGLSISDAGGLDLDAMNTAALRLTAVRAAVLTDWIDGERLDLLLDAIPTTAEIKTAIEADGSKIDHIWETTEDDAGTRRFTAAGLAQAPGGGNVTVGDITTAALAKYCTEDTGETVGAAGSVAKIAQGTASGLTAADVADAVGDELLADHVISGSFGESWNRLDNIQIATDQLGSASVTVSSPIATDGDITLQQYDDYNNTETRSLEWTNSDGNWGPDDITDATVEFVIFDSDGTVKLTADGSVVTPTGTQKVRVELLNTETADLNYKTTYTYQLRLILDTSERQETIATGTVTVNTSGFTS